MRKGKNKDSRLIVKITELYFVTQSILCLKKKEEERSLAQPAGFAAIFLLLFFVCLFCFDQYK